MNGPRPADQAIRDRPSPGSEASLIGWSDLWKFTQQHKRSLIWAQGLAALATVFNALLPLLFPILIDQVLLDQPGRFVAKVDNLFPAVASEPWLYVSVVLSLTIFLRLLALALNVIQARQFALISKDVTYRLRRSLLGQLADISMAEYETLGGGAVASNLVTDLRTIEQFIGVTLSRLLMAVLLLVAVAVVLLWMHWQLALFILILNPFVVLLTTRLGRRVKKFKVAENESIETFQQALTETLDAIQQIRASNREQHYFERLAEHAREVRDRSATFAWKSDFGSRSSSLVLLLGFDFFRAMSVLMVVFSGLTIGQMVAVFNYLWFMLGPVQEVLGLQYAYYSADGALGRINRLQKLQREPCYPHLEDPFAGRRSVAIRTEDLCFSYGDGPRVLKGVSLEISVGETVALVGASGGGKSTLVQILLGLYPATSGKVYFGGVPIDRIGLDVVREHVATVLQSPALLDDSVRANLTLGRDHDDRELWQALRIAQVHDVVRQLPQGLDSLLGRQGLRLSGGQRQRIAIARMILADPAIVILDEATSAIDLETEDRLYRALEGFLEPRTTLIIAHRLSALNHADRVFVFEDGQIAEQGRHADLVAQDGFYAKLYAGAQPGA